MNTEALTVLTEQMQEGLENATDVTLALKAAIVRDDLERVIIDIVELEKAILAINVCNEKIFTLLHGSRSE